jgi:hypothetical protein
MADVLKDLQELRKGHDQYRHTTNKELERLRRGRGEDKSPREDGAGKAEPKDAPVTRDELRAERAYMRDLGKLEALGLDADALQKVEDECEDLSPSERARYVAALARGMGLVSKEPKTQERDRDGRHRRTQAGKGNEAPPRSKSSDVPRTIAEYRALKKSDQARARELVESGEIDLVALARAK